MLWVFFRAGSEVLAMRYVDGAQWLLLISGWLISRRTVCSDYRPIIVFANQVTCT